MPDRLIAPHPAARAEPRSIGSSRARDPLAREVKLLGALLGQVIAEQAGVAALELVERVRRATIALRREGAREAARQRLSAELDELDLPTAELLITAFSLYFQLVNLAEEKQRVRRLRRRQRRAPGSPVPESLAAALASLRRSGMSEPEVERLIGRLTLNPVLTAHPTEARRRTLLVALRRVYRLLDRLDDPRLTPAEDGELRRRLREEITLLWHTPPIRQRAPAPLDEVRSVMAVFDESLYVVTPRVYRALEQAVGHAGAGTSGSTVQAFLRWGSWVGGDRDGNPGVTAALTAEALRVGADHALRAHEQVCRRLAQVLAIAAPAGPQLRARLATDAAELPATAAVLERFAEAPYRRRLLFMAERLRRTRLNLVGSADGSAPAGGYRRADELTTEVAELADALRAAGLGRVADGEVQELRWQLASFGFHGLALELRQHSDVHRATLAATGRATQVAPGVSAGEVLATFRAMADGQAQLGAAACSRYVVSFSRSAADVLGVLELAERALGPRAAALELDVVPLFESADALAASGRIATELFSAPAYAAHLERRGRRQEVMLGYSDSTRESGALAAAWMLQQAEQRLVAAARRHAVELTIFHGRGGAIGRGGGPMTRAVMASAAGAVDARLKLTEQGEVVVDRYANPEIAQRHLEQMTFATLLASTATHDQAVSAASEIGTPVLTELAGTARRRYRALVWRTPGFADYFRAATPIDELARLAIGSRPATRGTASYESLRAIPWVFAWSQSRANLPGWYGTGSALAAFREAHGAAGLRRLHDLYAAWPFFAGVVDTTEMVLAKADMDVAQRYASLAPVRLAQRIWGRISDEYALAVEQILAVTGHARLLANAPVLARSIELRNPYVDSLSELQVRLLARLRAQPAADAQRATLLRLVQLTVNGVAAGLQNTG